MRPKILCASLAMALAAGCAVQGDPRAWSIEPVISVRGDMRDARAAYHLGRYYQDMGQLDKAETAYTRAIAADEGHAEALNALGTLYARGGKLERAVETLERVAAIAPLAAHVHNNLGYALLLAGRNDAAASALQRAVQLDHRNRRAWHNLADAYHRLGDPTKAELADARASGNWSEEALAPTARSKPRPITPSATPVDVSARPAGAERLAAPAAPSPQGPLTHEVRLVKLAENMYELRHGPEPTAGLAQAPGGSPVATAAASVVPAAQVPVAPAHRAPRPAATPVAATPVAANSVAANSVAAEFAPANPVAASPVAANAMLVPVSLTALEPPPKAAAGATSSPGATSAAPATRPVRYEVSNGQGRDGLARHVAGLLRQEGLPWPRLTNQRPFTEPTSVVQYRRGFREAAEALAARLSFRPAVAPAPAERLVADVRLLLGHDLAASASCAELNLCPRPILAAAGADE